MYVAVSYTCLTCLLFNKLYLINKMTCRDCRGIFCVRSAVIIWCDDKYIWTTLMKGQIVVIQSYRCCNTLIVNNLRLQNNILSNNKLGTDIFQHWLAIWIVKLVPISILFLLITKWLWKLKHSHIFTSVRG